jgi:hypothetical protein
MGWHRKVVTWFTPDEPKAKFVTLCKDFNHMHAVELDRTGRDFIVKYIKDENKNRIGTLVAYPSEDGNSIRIGWSSLNRVRDRWNKHVGLYHAFRRAESDYSENLPSIVYDEIGDFYERATRYFTKNRAGQEANA